MCSFVTDDRKVPMCTDIGQPNLVETPSCDMEGTVHVQHVNVSYCLGDLALIVNAMHFNPPRCVQVKKGTKKKK